MKILLIGGCGYVGSYLHQRLLADGAEVTVCDLELRGNPLATPLIESDYRNLSSKSLQRFDGVLWFAGHSSVGSAVNDPIGALHNNCLGLFQLVQNLNDHTKFIYASTGSLYTSALKYPAALDEESLKMIPKNNPYDSSKFAFDYLLSNFTKHKTYLGLRMGTICGFSPNLRAELVFNAMSIAASERGIVSLRNAESWRTILFLEDLWILVRTILRKKMNAGFINAGSLTMTMRALSEKISTAWGACIENNGDSATYSFRLDCRKMRILCGHDLSRRLVSRESKNFIATYRSK